MVVIVAVLLSLAALGLKERQDNNILNEKKTQIVKALGYDAATVSYDDVVAEAALLNAEGVAVENDTQKVFDALQSVKDTRAAGQFPIFKATDGSVVVPLYGAGLWGPIWGYIALDADKNTVYGTYFSHQGETPGLGAEIAKPKFQNAFKSKKIKNAAGEFVSIAIVKPGKTDDTKDYVDGISGGTITSQGVDAMLKDGLGQYVNFLNK
jgi:Na+-transporting NADH:ubiquinone oxidoreductase subunit C